MQLKYILPAAVLSTLASGTPVRRAPEKWQVSQFSTGCSPGGCVFNFNILSAATKNTPAFNTTCEGTDEAGDYQACSDKSVSANLLPRTYPTWGVQVKHEWTDGTGQYYALGDKNITDGMTTFTIPVTQAYGVN